MDYIAIIHKDTDSEYGVSFPDFPGCVTAGKTLEEAKNMAVEALSFHIEGMIEDKETIPVPASLDEVMIDPVFQSGVAFIVSYAGRPKQVRFNLSAMDDALATIDAAAQKSGLTRSAFMVQSSLEKAGSASHKERL